MNDQRLAYALAQIGQDINMMLADEAAHVVATGHQIVSEHSIPGVTVSTGRTADAIVAKVTVAAAQRVEQPIHMCFALFERFDVQRVIFDLTLEPDAEAQLLSHCLFTTAEALGHRMEATITLAPGARLVHTEGHYHGTSGVLDVRPQAVVKLARGAYLLSDFSLTSGRVGVLNIDYSVDVGEDATAELTSRIFGHVTDRIMIRERVMLSGARARGLIKSRVAVEDDAVAEVIGITEGNAPEARGHVDCTEIVKDRAIVSASPIVKVTHPQAKVTHEAAIGSVDRQQMETLMAHGLSPDQAVERIVRGLLR